MDNLEFSLIGIEEIKVNIQIPNDIEDKSKQKPGFTFDLKIDQKFDKAKEYIFIECNIKTFFTGDEPDHIIAEYSGLCVFHVIGLKKMYKKSKVDMPESLHKTLIGTTISTTRGLMYGHFKGTYLHTAILPMIPLVNEEK